ncbi:hypothetical protein [Borrelia turicatae]|uniref:hypothetical protein n=1 Tax=Borrelia turicatae TaxID=142 RepID=UPI002ED14400
MKEPMPYKIISRSELRQGYYMARKAGQQKDCKFRHLLEKLDSLFPRIDHQTFLSIVKYLARRLI